MRGKISLLFAFAFAFAAASLGFSQTNGTTSTSTSTNTVNATVLASGGQVSAMPGVMGMPGVFPGFPEQNGTFVPYWNGLFHEISCAEMEAGRGKHDKVKTKVLIPNNGSDKDCSPIYLLNWSPFNPQLFYRDDKEVTVTYALGKGDEQPEETLLAALYDVKKNARREKSHVSRCVAFIREINEGITTGFSIGTGGSGGMTPGPGANNSNVAFAGGGLLGKNTTRQVNRPEFRIVCLNDGPLDPPRPPAKAEVLATPPAPRPASPAPPAQTMQVEKITQPPSTPPPPTTAIPTPIASCDLPTFIVYFGFNESNVKDEYRASIKSIATWLENHPACKVQVEGNASTEGSFAFNAALARDRAKAVYNILAEDKNILGQLVQFVSVSKDRATSERNPADHNVILRVVGNDSGR